MTRDDIQIIRLGQERQPLIILDNFAPDPQTLIADAKGKTYSDGGRHYPGIRASADFTYLNARAELLQKIFVELLGCPSGVEITESNYSLVTTPEPDLTPIQSLPHFDGFNPHRFAILHYLCPPGHGGTAFYRHKATGYETVTQDRYAAYDAELQKEVAEDGVPSGYFRGSDRFEQTYRVEPKFNRLVIYRGILLHSGDMVAGFTPDADPETGRLTVNIFGQRAGN